MHRFVSHTGELQLELEAPTEAAVFEDAAGALGELMDGGRGEAARRDVALAGSDLGGLLVDWLNELVFLAETEGFVPERAADVVLADGSLRATVEGRIAAPAPLVKAVTYHELAFERRGGGWFARVVLDV